MAYKQIKSLQRLLDQLRKLPYLSSKQLYKIAIYLLEKPDQDVQLLCQTILASKNQIKECHKCFDLTESDFCQTCNHLNRNHQVICVVENWANLKNIEETNEFGGSYHVLKGLINPLQGVFAGSLTINHLLKRIEKDNIEEVIFALNSSPEGEVTAAFIASEMSKIKPNLRLSKLASGIPLGACLEYLDKTTLTKALAQRQNFG